MLAILSRRRSPLRSSRAPRGRPLSPTLEPLETRAVPATLFVDDNLAECPDADFTSIQAAVNAAKKGDKIQVCPGLYDEQVTIPAGKDRLDIRSTEPLMAVIQGPPGSAPGIVEIDGAKDVKIRGFTIRGPLDLSEPGAQAGVFVGGGGSATIEQNHITDIRNEPLDGAQDGYGILVGSGGAPESTSPDEVGSATIRQNLIDDYQKGGIVIDNKGSRAVIEDNDVIGAGPTGFIAQVGIQIGYGAAGDVKNNTVSDNQYTGADFAATGILFFENGRSTVSRNTVVRNDYGIYLEDNAAKTEVSRNHVSDSTYDGIHLFEASDVKVSDNDVRRSGFDGIYLESSSGVAVEKNTSAENEFGGITLFFSDGNVIEKNTASANESDGIRLVQSDGNVIEKNEAKSNGLDGIRLEMSSGNVIEKNTASSNGGHGIFLSGSDGNVIEKNETESNGFDGIHLELSSGNVVEKNKSRDNGGFDCFDDTCGAANDWEKNEGESDNCDGQLCDGGGHGDDDDDDD